MSVNALIDTATGAVISWGACEFFPADDQSVVEVVDPMTHPGGPDEYVRVIDGMFAAMTSPEERVAVDQVIPHKRIMRFRRMPEIQVTTGNADPGNGWTSAFVAPLQAPALVGGNYQLAITFEFALLAAAAWTPSGPSSGAQVRLLMNGSEIATWLSTLSEYDCRGGVYSAAVATRARPVFDVQLRRFGAPATARLRRLVLTVSPMAKLHIDE